MEFLLLLGAGLALFGPASGSSAPVVQPQTTGGGDPPKLPEDSKFGLSTPSLVGLGLLVSQAAGELGQALTGDVGGRIAGTLNAGTGTAINVGRVAGSELDKALGGTGKEATGAIAQVAGGTAAAVGSILGGFAAVSSITLFAPIYALGSIISDVNRLKYGQAGALKDFQRQRGELQAKVFTALRSKGLSDAQAWRISVPYSDGFQMEANRRAFRIWMARGKGLLGLGTISDRDHAKWGADRGYFAGGVLGTALVDPELLSDVPDYRERAQVPSTDLVEIKVQATIGTAPRWVDRDDVFQPYKAPVTGILIPSQCATWKAQGKGESDPAYRAACMVQVPFYPITEEQTRQVDRTRNQWLDQGIRNSNVAGYLAAMKKPRGLGQTDASHAAIMRKEGEFTGDLGPAGVLLVDGKTIDWRNAA